MRAQCIARRTEQEDSHRVTTTSLIVKEEECNVLVCLPERQKNHRLDKFAVK